MGFFSKLTTQHLVKTMECHECGDRYRGVPDQYPYCGRCLERIRDRVDARTRAEINHAFKLRADRF